MPEEARKRQRRWHDWVYDDRKVRLGTDHRNGAEIQCISGGSFIGTDAALAEYYIGIAFRNDIFGGIQHSSMVAA